VLCSAQALKCHDSVCTDLEYYGDLVYRPWHARAAAAARSFWSAGVSSQWYRPCQACPRPHFPQTTCMRLTLVWMSRTIFESKSSGPLSSSDLHQLQAAEPLPAAVIKQIAKELKDLQEKPEEGIKVCLLTPLAGSSCFIS